MRTWSRTCPMKKGSKGNYTETWISKRSSQRTAQHYAVNVRLGKQTDIFSIKSNVVNNFRSRLLHIRSTRSHLFRPISTKNVKICPICGSPSNKAQFIINVYGARFCQCLNCSHCFVTNRPTKATLEKFYSCNKQYAVTYTDKKTSIARESQITVPKAKWMIEQFKALYGRKPRTVLDVGAGAGHFVHTLRRLGINAMGIELNKSCIDFCKSNFGIKLETIDFVKHWKAFSDIDIITFWGVIEHVTKPVAMLQAAHNVLSKRQGLIVTEVPRCDSLSTTVQGLFSNNVVRHLDPLGHINVFTDNSLATSFEISGFAPVAAWYFGMDAYELTMQLFHSLKNKRILNVLKKSINCLQETIDHGQLSDTIVLAGKPIA